MYVCMYVKSAVHENDGKDTCSRAYLSILYLGLIKLSLQCRELLLSILWLVQTDTATIKHISFFSWPPIYRRLLTLLSDFSSSIFLSFSSNVTFSLNIPSHCVCTHTGVEQRSDMNRTHISSSQHTMRSRGEAYQSLLALVTLTWTCNLCRRSCICLLVSSCRAASDTRRLCSSLIDTYDDEMRWEGWGHTTHDDEMKAMK